MTDAPSGLSQDDRALWLRARNGDREAFGELVRRHQRRVWMVCRGYVGPEEADAAAQEAFLKAWRALDRFDGRSAFGTWLVRIAINASLDLLRRRRREGARRATEDPDGPGQVEAVPDAGADPERRAIQREAVRRLARAEAALPRRQREVFRLRFYAEMELPAIAEALGVSVGTVKTQLHRAVHRVRRELEDVR